MFFSNHLFFVFCPLKCKLCVHCLIVDPVLIVSCLLDSLDQFLPPINLPVLKSPTPHPFPTSPALGADENLKRITAKWGISHNSLLWMGHILLQCPVLFVRVYQICCTLYPWHFQCSLSTFCASPVSKGVSDAHLCTSWREEKTIKSPMLVRSSNSISDGMRFNQGLNGEKETDTITLPFHLFQRGKAKFI